MNFFPPVEIDLLMNKRAADFCISPWTKRWVAVQLPLTLCSRRSIWTLRSLFLKAFLKRKSSPRGEGLWKLSWFYSVVFNQFVSCLRNKFSLFHFLHICGGGSISLLKQETSHQQLLFIGTGLFWASETLYSELKSSPRSAPCWGQFRTTLVNDNFKIDWS